MELGAVKHALNNEIIRLKKNLNQARTQTINKLTRKIKILKSRKGPDKEKFTRKAQNVLSEVVLLKKVKAKELVRFVMTCDENLQSYINKPNVSEERAMARLLQHKSLVDKAKMLKDTFGCMPVDQLLLTKKERLQLMKEQELKSQGKIKKTVVTNGAGKFEEENISENINLGHNSDAESGYSQHEGHTESLESELEDETEHIDRRQPQTLVNNVAGESSEVSDSNSLHNDNDLDEYQSGEENDDVSSDNEGGSKSWQPRQRRQSQTVVNNVASESSEVSDSNSLHNDKGLDENQSGEENENMSSDNEGRSKSWKPGQFVLRNPNSQNDLSLGENIEDINEDHKRNAKGTNEGLSKSKVNKLKQIKKKTLKERNKKFEMTDIREDEMKPEATIVDPFFITQTGEHYRTLAEPRMPDFVKDDDTHANRKMRRAAMFGRPIKPAFNNNNKSDDRKGFKGQPYNKEFRGRPPKPDDSFGRKDPPAKYSNTPYNKTNVPERMVALDKRKADVKEQKLHPSWEAKKQKSGIVAFQGKKVVFNNDD